MNYWLMKTEPETFSINDLKQAGTEPWDGVRNYQARNYMMKEMKQGDIVLIYHSNTKPPGIAGLGTVASKTYPDPTQFDKTSKYYDEKSPQDNPRWWLVDIAYKETFTQYIPLEQLRAEPKLATMKILQKGNRLSITPVTKEEFDVVLKMRV